MSFVAEEPFEQSPSLPPVNLLNLQEERPALDEAELIRLGEQIRSAAPSSASRARSRASAPGPVITVFELQPAPGVKVSQIVNLQDDLALALRAESVRIDRVPGRSTLGIEVPNVDRRTIALGPLLADDRFQRSPSVLTMALGRDLHGKPYYADLATMPHLLVAGATGSGKSVGLQSMLTSILYKATRDQVQFILIDPKRIELGVYSDIPHLKTEVVVEPKKAANALRWAVAEMERRYKLLAELHVRSIAYYNHAIGDPEVQRRLALRDEEGETEVRQEDLKPLPYFVIVIDELADLMMVCLERGRDRDRSTGADGARGGHPPHRRHPAPVGRRAHRHHQGQLPLPHRLRHRQSSRLAHDPRQHRRRAAAGQGRHAVHAAVGGAAGAAARRLHQRAGDRGLMRWLKRQGKPQLDPDVLKAPAEDALAAAAATTARTSCSRTRRGWW